MRVVAAVLAVLGTTALALNITVILPQTFDTESSLLTEISEVQQDAVSKSGKYERTKPRSGFDFEIHEYVSPHDGPGYQVIFTRTIEVAYQRETASGSGTFQDAVRSKVQTKSVGYGPQAQIRTWEWR